VVVVLKKVAFTMYPIRNVARARQFYEETLGLTAGLNGNKGDQWCIEYDLPGGGCIALTNFISDEPSAAARGTIAFKVEDLDALIADLKSKGTTFRGGVVANLSITFLGVISFSSRICVLGKG
jgi:hypothetical protein